MTEASLGQDDGKPVRVKLKPRGQVPFVQQLEAADCGAASLAMVLGYWGCEVRLDDLRDAVGVTTDGVSAQAILEVAARYGLAGRGLRAGVEHLKELPRGSILHWEFAHFVVFDGMGSRGVKIVDPATGRREVPLDVVDRKFTGIALLLTPTERFVPNKGDRKRLLPYLRKLFSTPALLLRVLSMTALLQILAMVLPAVTGVIVDRVVPRSDMDLLWVIAGGAGLAVVFSMIAALVRAHLLVELRAKLDMKMTVDFTSHLVALPFSYFQRRQAGDLMMRVNSNATVREFLTSEVVTALLDGVMVTIYIVVMSALSWSMAGLALGLGVARVLLILAVHGRFKELMANQLDAKARCQSYLAQMLAGIETLKAAGAERRAVEHWTNLYSKELNEVAARGRLEAVSRSILRAFDSASPLVILSWGAYLVLSGELTLGTMLALNSFAVGFLTPLSTLANSGLQFSMLGGYLDRMDDVLEAEPEQDRGSVRNAPRLRGAVSVRSVCFRYRNDGPLAVDNATLEVAAGSTVAIVGPSGCGKSTLARLLLGLHRPQEGQILFDGQDISEMDAVSLRRQIGIVPQQPYLFASSIRDNIALGDPSAPLHRVVDAARLARIHDDIARLPMQYDTILADRGETLSGGQRQRIALARAVLQRPAKLLAPPRRGDPARSMPRPSSPLPATWSGCAARGSSSRTA